MALATDAIFVSAIESNSEIMEAVGGDRLYPTAIPFPDEKAESVPVPYIIITFDDDDNQDETKDDGFEGSEDKVNIGILVTASTIDDLYTLTSAIRKTVRRYISETDTPIQDYHFGARAKQYDPYKPCYAQVLTYACKVLRDGDDDL